MIPADRRVVEPRTAAEFRAALDDAVNTAKEAQSTLKASVLDIDHLREQAAGVLPAGDVDLEDQVADLQAEVDCLRERQQRLLGDMINVQHQHARTLCELEEVRHARRLGEAGECALLLRDIIYTYGDHDFSAEAEDSAFDLWAGVLRHREGKRTSDISLYLALDRLSQLCGGWWTFRADDTSEFVALPDWERQYAQATVSSEELERVVADEDDTLPF